MNCRDRLCGSYDCGTCFPGADRPVKCAGCDTLIAQGLLCEWTEVRNEYLCDECVDDRVKEYAEEIDVLLEDNESMKYKEIHDACKALLKED